MTDLRLPNWVANANEPCWHVPSHGQDVLVAACGHRIHGPVDATRDPYPPANDGRSPCTDCIVRTGIEPTRRRRTFAIAMAALYPAEPVLYPAETTLWKDETVIRPHV